MSRSDLCFHLAAAAGVELIDDKPLESLATNIRGSEIVFEKAHKHATRVLVTSTNQIYGKSTSDRLGEEDDRILGSPLKNPGPGFPQPAPDTSRRCGEPPNVRPWRLLEAARAAVGSKSQDYRAAVAAVRARGWRVDEDRGGYPMAFCPCGKHMKTIKMTPSNPKYFVNLRAWFARCNCPGEEEAL